MVPQNSEVIIQDKKDQLHPPEKEVSRSRKFKIRWRLSGKCTNCGAEPLQNKKQCEKCVQISKRLTQRYRSLNKEKYKQIYHERKRNGICPHCGQKPSRDGGVTCSDCYREEWGYRIRIKNNAIQKYGGSCRCCGENNIMFLSIDHKHGGGTKERQVTKKVGGGLYKLLNKLPIDNKYQVMCYNCNFAKGDRSECPHEYMEEVERALNWSPKLISRIKRKYA